MAFIPSKSYAEVVIGKSSFVQSSWSHIQTQQEEEALRLAIKNSIREKVIYRFLCLEIVPFVVFSITFFLPFFSLEYRGGLNYNCWENIRNIRQKP